jgi:uncharacterized protein
VTEDLMQYDRLTERAMRLVIREALEIVAKDGLPGEHHLFITFDTNAQDVRIAERLKADHPKEMTIILQHQFRDLIVRDDSFSVGLSFGQIPENLHIPYDAITSFYDPHVEFGLRFHGEGDDQDDEDFDDSLFDGETNILDTSMHEPKKESQPNKSETEKGGDNVVRIDLFRDK